MAGLTEIHQEPTAFSLLCILLVIIIFHGFAHAVALILLFDRVNIECMILTVISQVCISLGGGQGLGS